MSTSNNIRLKLPPGFRFDATEEELVCHYLYGKLNGNLTPIEQQFIMDCDFYGIEEPWEIWERFGGQELNDGGGLFFFSQLKKVKPYCKNISRKVGSSDGKWHGETSGYCSSLKLRGLTSFKKRFTYKNPKILEQDRCWNMLEYSLDLGEFGMVTDSIVLCQLKRSTRNPQYDKKRKLQNLYHGDEPNSCQNNGFIVNKRSRFEEELSKMIQINQKNSPMINKIRRDSNVGMEMIVHEQPKEQAIPPNTSIDHDLGIIDNILAQMLMQKQQKEVAQGMSNNYGWNVAETETGEEQEPGAVCAFNNNIYGSEIAEIGMMSTFNNYMWPVPMAYQVQQEQEAKAGLNNNYGMEVAETAALLVLNANYSSEVAMENDNTGSNLQATTIGKESNNNGLFSEEGQGPIAGENTLQNVMKSCLQQLNPQPQLNDYESWLLDESSPFNEMKLMKELLLGHV